MPRQEIPKQYNPKATESTIYDFWLKGKFFTPQPTAGKKSYTIVIPPPNVTDVLHLGHAFNNTFQDITVRYRRMQGYETLWLPGTDHAGIATQVVVEKRLAKEGKSKKDLGREKFAELVWDWVRQNGDYILNQLKKLGFSCDWSRTRFTLDEKLSQAVAEVFVRLYKKNLIYRGKYIINWCPRCLTSLSDDETEVEKKSGWLYFIKYPLEGEKEKFLTVATTRPETMLGDTALAVNPDDKRYKKFVGKTALLPIVGRKLKIVADSYVDPEFGTGVVKITPAHDRNDFDLAKRHNLEIIEIMNPDATINQNGGKFQSQDRYQTRENIVSELKELKLLEETEPYQVPLGFCYRCRTAVEPYLSEQWFVKMRPLAQPAVKAVKDGELRFHPGHWSKVYLHWLENIHDWCISRQLWWGHRIPVWYCQECKEIIVATSAPAACAKCKSENLKQDEDVLDTWFSSWLWPFSTLGWPEETPDLKFFYPTNSLFTASEIIFLWVARMVMAGCEFRNQIPFSDVYIHGTVRDAKGIKMSKSLGNGIDPLDVVKEHGADSLRLSLVLIAPDGQDPLLSFNSFELGRNFCNKLWNASRLVMMNLHQFDPGQAELSGQEQFTLADKWILTRLQQTISSVGRYLDEFRFNLAGKALYDFFWKDFCDWYLELAKPRFDEKNSTPDSQLVKKISVYILDSILRLLSPFIPFVTEQIWRNLYSLDNNNLNQVLMTSAWPRLRPELQFDQAVPEMEKLQEVITAIRTLKSDLGIAPGLKPAVILKTDSAAISDLLANHCDYISEQGRVEKPQVTRDSEKPPQAVTAVVSGVEIFLLLAGMVDIEKEKGKLTQELQKLSQLTEQASKKLSDPNFLDKAPAPIVQKEKEKKADLERKLEKIKKNLETLK